MLNTIKNDGTDLRTTIASGWIVPEKIEYEWGKDVFAEMFENVDFNQNSEHEEDHIQSHGFKSYIFARDENDGSQFWARISEVGENQKLPTNEEALEDEETWFHQYFEVELKDGEKEYYNLEIKLEKAEIKTFWESECGKITHEGNFEGFFDSSNGDEPTKQDAESNLDEFLKELLGQCGEKKDVDFILNGQFGIHFEVDGDEVGVIDYFEASSIFEKLPESFKVKYQ